MGSIEVFDYKQQKWVPSNPDPEKVYQHFKDLRDGYVFPDHRGRYVIGSGTRYRKLKEAETDRAPVVKLVTPVAQATEIAKSEIRRKNAEESPIAKKRKKTKVNDEKKRKYTKYNPDFTF